MPIGPFDRFNDRAKRVLALAQDEAIRFNHNYIGTEHLLLGLVREGEGVAARALDSLGIELSKVRTAVELTIGRGKATTSPSEITLSPRTKKVIELAIDEARKLGHSHVGTEHLLLGLVRSDSAWLRRVWTELATDLEALATQLAAAAPPREGAPPASLRLGTELGVLIGRALARAAERNSALVRPEHLLIAIADEQDSAAAKLLASLGATCERVREVVDKRGR